MLKQLNLLQHLHEKESGELAIVKSVHQSEEGLLEEFQVGVEEVKEQLAGRRRWFTSGI